MNVSRLPRGRAAVVFAVTVVVGLVACAATDSVDATPLKACGTAGTWVDPVTGKGAAPTVVIDALAARRVVLLGEQHDNADHHRWQAQMLAALHGRRGRMVIAFESFPRQSQPALDRWVAGELSEKDFLDESRWSAVWGFGADMYMPLFQFARLNRLPMVAANVDRALVRRVGQKGWDGVPEAEREGVGRPVPASAAYQRSLAVVFQAKMKAGIHGSTSSKDSPPEIADILKRPGFERFVAAQLTWDRAMAEAIASAAKAHPDALVVGIMGRGHVEFGNGVPHQLRDLGIDDVAVALPMAPTDCADLPRDIADAVFMITNPPATAADGAPRKPKLGVVIEGTPKGVKVSRVVDGSVAAAAGIAKGDVITQAAGVPVKRNQDLIAIIGRQAPGTWLPLRVVRGGETLDMVAKFPARPSQGE